MLTVCALFAFCLATFSLLISQWRRRTRGTGICFISLCVCVCVWLLKYLHFKMINMANEARGRPRTEAELPIDKYRRGLEGFTDKHEAVFH